MSFGGVTLGKHFAILNRISLLASLSYLSVILCWFSIFYVPISELSWSSYQMWEHFDYNVS